MNEIVPTEMKPCDKGRILITDDEAQIRKLFTTLISFDLPDLRIDTACNGLEAVRAFKESRHGVLLMDVRMPEMDGLQAFEAIQELCRQENQEMPAVIFCTGFMPPDRVTELVGDQKYHCILHKPVKSEQIINAVQERLKK